ncbi:MAG TPA: DUF1565 domain-containing protein, partial [Vicinamibacterales bacterium]|nr:DUF1565 domain-containing protein [Vicinamibacterales bacterium]
MGRRLITPPSEWGALRRFIGVWLALVLTFGGPSAFAATWFVNPNTGLDTNPGIAGSPFRTITHALSVALSGDTISAAAGIYDALSGETFPLHLKDGVAIVGAGPASSTIDGQGAVTGLDNALFENSGTDLGPTTRLSGFSLRNGTTLFDEDIMFFDLGANNMSPQIDNNNFASAIGSADGILVQWNGGAGQFNANIQ